MICGSKHPKSITVMLTHTYTYACYRSVPRNNTMVIASEELDSDPWNVWVKVSSLVPGLKRELLQLGNFSKTRYNTQDSASKDQKVLMTGVPKEKYKPGVFAISNFQPLLPETRALLDKCWMDDCLLISQITGKNKSDIYLSPARLVTHGLMS
jgi:hypothetical protein